MNRNGRYVGFVMPQTMTDTAGTDSVDGEIALDVPPVEIGRADECKVDTI
jgi:hypothetical protein